MLVWGYNDYIRGITLCTQIVDSSLMHMCMVKCGILFPYQASLSCDFKGKEGAYRFPPDLRRNHVLLACRYDLDRRTSTGSHPIP
jgi:hypothetical protein